MLVIYENIECRSEFRSYECLNRLLEDLLSTTVVKKQFGSTRETRSKLKYKEMSLLYRNAVRNVKKHFTGRHGQPTVLNKFGKAQIFLTLFLTFRSFQAGRCPALH